MFSAVGSTVGSAVDTVEAEVRELVRRRGLGPVEDRLAMRRLIDEVAPDVRSRHPPEVSAPTLPSGWLGTYHRADSGHSLTRQVPQSGE